jgi:hypothetical protein
VTALCYTPDGSQLAAAVGGGIDILDSNALETRLARLPSELDDAAVALRSAVTALRYSPDGSLLAALDADAVSLFVSGSWATKRSINVKASGIDLSDDNAWLQVSTDALELLYFNVETGEPATSRAVKAANATFYTCGPGPSKVAFEKQGSHLVLRAL